MMKNGENNGTEEIGLVTPTPLSLTARPRHVLARQIIKDRLGVIGLCIKLDFPSTKTPTTTRSY